MLMPVGGTPRAILMVICIFRILLCLGVLPPLSLVSLANDVFCGELQVYKQQWFDQHTAAISSQNTNDLKQCLELCCRGEERSISPLVFMTQPECLEMERLQWKGWEGVGVGYFQGDLANLSYHREGKKYDL
ncbi:hypothetical protein Tcan_06605 [Toxocara canis]|uniref:Uncharacterized protein n=1 Tax=Toxocara canis TaxID=6265 RepID=A0A0B2W1X0_TOXCA|nr:hypothetical protein Tcan_06605 [Toxocara canis]